MTVLADPLEVARALIACRSVTPADGGAQDVLARMLEALGFTVTRLAFGDTAAPTPNLFARIGEGPPHLAFAGHTDVVPPGSAGWTVDAFTPDVRDGVLYGRGACDMKGGIAAFVGACAAFLAGGRPARGSISLLITGDEEGPATHGTRAMVAWLRETRSLPDFCLVGEPTNPEHLGETIKVGRRGSLNAELTVLGRQGHAAYPERADNPVHRLVALLAELTAARLDEGSQHFAPSGLQVTSVDVGNAATNVIPAQATARLNIRFNDRQTGEGLERWLRDVAQRHAPLHELMVTVGAEPFLGREGPELAALVDAIVAVTGRRPVLDTGGGTSDARFLAPFCRVAEFGLVGASMHAVDECVPVADLGALTDIYERWLRTLLSAAR